MTSYLLTSILVLWSLPSVCCGSQKFWLLGGTTNPAVNAEVLDAVRGFAEDKGLSFQVLEGRSREVEVNWAARLPEERTFCMLSLARAIFSRQELDGRARAALSARVLASTLDSPDGVSPILFHAVAMHYVNWACDPEFESANSAPYADRRVSAASGLLAAWSKLSRAAYSADGETPPEAESNLSLQPMFPGSLLRGSRPVAKTPEELRLQEKILADHSAACRFHTAVWSSLVYLQEHIAKTEGILSALYTRPPFALEELHTLLKRHLGERHPATKRILEKVATSQPATELTKSLSLLAALPLPLRPDEISDPWRFETNRAISVALNMEPGGTSRLKPEPSSHSMGPSPHPTTQSATPREAVEIERASLSGRMLLYCLGGLAGCILIMAVLRANHRPSKGI